MKSFVIAVTLFSAFVALMMSPCQGFCIPSLGWHAKSLVERIELGEAEVVVLATVEATHRHDQPHKPHDPYTVDLVVDCVYKDTSGGPSHLPRYLKDVTGFGGTWDCAQTKVEAGKQYIVFLNREGIYAYTVAEVNGQSGAEQAIPSRIIKLEQKYQCI